MMPYFEVPSVDIPRYLCMLQFPLIRNRDRGLLWFGYPDAPSLDCSYWAGVLVCWVVDVSMYLRLRYVLRTMG